MAARCTADGAVDVFAHLQPPERCDAIACPGIHVAGDAVATGCRARPDYLPVAFDADATDAGPTTPRA
jgi:hypothetical protein